MKHGRRRGDRVLSLLPTSVAVGPPRLNGGLNATNGGRPPHPPQPRRSRRHHLRTRPPAGTSCCRRCCFALKRRRRRWRRLQQRQKRRLPPSLPPSPAVRTPPTAGEREREREREREATTTNNTDETTRQTIEGGRERDARRGEEWKGEQTDSCARPRPPSPSFRSLASARARPLAQ